MLLGLALFIFSVQNACAQSSTDYLQTLEGEASSLELDGKTKSTGSSSGTAPVDSPASIGQGGAITDLRPGLSIEQFEQLLQRNYIGSYLFYKRLNDQGKQEVYAHYQSYPEPEKIREKILQISKR